MIQLLSENGFDPLFRPGMLLSNWQKAALLWASPSGKGQEIKSEHCPLQWAASLLV